MDECGFVSRINTLSGLLASIYAKLPSGEITTFRNCPDKPVRIFAVALLKFCDNGFASIITTDEVNGDTFWVQET